ncbi:MAG: isoprenylcysteine carboxylmethyltransferase family protein [Candidatus Omnitrophica bacterium]|nr:isoprenylcysteine carboxylmethyltransferase family protein [Candidatus Omnitrophota bacterium]MDD5310516.1 isoprenylcysteine carboxylmethyltransferase family protein [Candidatus Omnitrophota bacterium]MDD5546058.1 isoprenylcysteine carboxylmethyltransferase family protein [Candidatus Omnitrophota bacterium]
MDIRERLKRWFKLRFAVLYPFAVFVAVFANCDDRSLKYGIWFIAAGELIRLWANGYAIKSEKLTTSGPYAFVRHPLYLGTMLLIVGFIIFLRVYYIGTALLAVMAIVYSGTIKEEEGMLGRKFKEYAAYKKKVPALFPTVFPYREGEKWGFSSERFFRSQEYKPVLWIAIVVIAFYLKGKFMVEGEPVDAGKIRLMAVVVLLVMADISGEIVKWFNRRKR